ncbi:MAG: hypothetical protein HY834_02340 [Devosia nanyangense]|uniref:Uncharacterized protein n=1 Tax=Devosia nanyangense TaxID=1228055 RepID=A0A933KZW3_9HYPH|nr:hypothetical protein [Devosia nanyangense]
MPGTEPAAGGITLSPRRLTVTITIAASVVLGLGYVRDVIGIVRGIPSAKLGFALFNLDAELTLSAWFASLLLALVSLLMLWAAIAERRRRLPTAPGWMLLGLAFIYMSLDEMSSIHEHFGDPFPALIDPVGLFTFRWVWIGLLLAVLAGAAFLPFLLRLPRRTAARLAVAGAVYVLGAVGFEMLSGAAVRAQGHSPTYLILMMVEESLEIAGLVLAVRCLALHLAGELGGPSLRLKPGS